MGRQRRICKRLFLYGDFFGLQERRGSRRQEIASKQEEGQVWTRKTLYFWDLKSFFFGLHGELRTI
jgi:hypothetical protein